jgi:putative modified peptide
VTESLSARSIDALLAKLGTDDEFRDQFAANPAKALATVGITLAAGFGLAGSAVAADSADGPTLADKTVFLAARAELRDGLAPAPFIPITLDFTNPGALASKEAFQDARQALRDGLSPSPFVPITLDFQPLA